MVTLLDYSNTNINTGASYTGAWVHCGNYERVRVSVYADQILQAHIEFSMDAVNIDAVSDTWDAAASVGEGYDWAVYNLYARVVVSNSSGVNTAACRIRMLGEKTC